MVNETNYWNSKKISFPSNFLSWKRNLLLENKQPSSMILVIEKLKFKRQYIFIVWVPWLKSLASSFFILYQKISKLKLIRRLPLIIKCMLLPVVLEIVSFKYKPTCFKKFWEFPIKACLLVIRYNQWYLSIKLEL